MCFPNTTAEESPRLLHPSADQLRKETASPPLNNHRDAIRYKVIVPLSNTEFSFRGMCDELLSVGEVKSLVAREIHVPVRALRILQDGVAPENHTILKYTTPVYVTIVPQVCELHPMGAMGQTCCAR